MRKIIGLFTLIAMLVLPIGALSADEATFSASSPKTQYLVGDEITVSFSVDAGAYATTLNAIEFDIAIDDTSVIEPANTSSPFTAGSIYSGVGFQSYSDGVINVLSHINPESQPANRSGLIGTVTFTALKEGRATISYDRIEAAEENDDTSFIDTSASSLTIEIGSGATSVSTSDSSAATSASSGTSRYTASTSTPTASTAASTGPEHVALAVVLVGFVAFLVFSWYKANKYYPKI